ncbi:tautomerase family protein [Streptomyces alanosinicus]|uniref:4-oxalocrotonate tautomerase-like domain-containing protein n=1 Tax=Streptomyces alanosinicus TaxID=68171 RepID=A0A919D5W8_9ACTN|nr:tautomerase family protein [Streptomyces alanosinicus]GHE12866.1 hypothetical protein GCM10010339_77960 [Streptomyces alanosinicus]
MPFISVRIFEERLDGTQDEEFIKNLTEAVTKTFGEESRSHTWVALEGTPAKRWGIAGRLGSKL